MNSDNKGNNIDDDDNKNSSNDGSHPSGSGRNWSVLRRGGRVAQISRRINPPASAVRQMHGSENRRDDVCPGQ
jgi:hypothetical protein